jgi:iron complex outermembrane receptor protein
MSDMPGVYMKKSNFADFTSSTSMSIRGVGGGERTLILYNGIPLNEPFWGMGHVEFGAISMDDVEQVDVVKGPFSSLYGGNAMAGVVNVITAIPEEDQVVLKTNYSSNNTMHNFFKVSKRLGDKWGISGTFDKLTSDGERNSYIDYIKMKEAEDTTGLTRVSGVGVSEDKYGGTQYFVGDTGEQSWDQDKFGMTMEFKPSPEHRFTLQTVYSDRTIDHRDARNYLVDDDGNLFDDGAFYFDHGGKTLTGSVTPTDFLYRMRWSPRTEKNLLSAFSYNGLMGKTDLTAQLGYVTHELERIKSRRTGATSFGGPAQSNEIDDYSIYFDSHATHPIGRHLITVGVSTRYNDANETVNEVSDWKDFDSVSMTTSDVTGDNMLYSVYTQGDIQLMDRLELFVGGRYDRWENSGGKSIARSKDGSQEEIMKFGSTSKGQFSPKIALLSKLSENTTLRGSWGMAFRAPTLGDLYRTDLRFGNRISYSNPDLDPETINSFDLGITQKLFNGRTTICSAVFYNEIKDMITTAKLNYKENGLDVRKKINVGRSESMGIELGLTHRILPWLKFSGNYTYTKSEVKENDLMPASEGKELELVPENMFNLALDANYEPFWARLSYEYADKVYGDGDITNQQSNWDVYGSYDEIRMLNFKIGCQINEHAEISYGCQNLLDREYYRGIGTGRADGIRHLVEATLKL